MVKHTIEQMTMRDFEEVIALWRATEGVGLTESDSKEGIAAFLERNAGLSFVARDGGGKLVGAVLCGYDGRRGYLHHLAVAKECRRHGTGKGLVNACLAKLRGLGVLKCNIFIFADNDSGRAFWERDGWKIREDLRMMQKFIGS